MNHTETPDFRRCMWCPHPNFDWTVDNDNLRQVTFQLPVFDDFEKLYSMVFEELEDKYNVCIDLPNSREFQEEENFNRECIESPGTITIVETPEHIQSRNECIKEISEIVGCQVSDIVIGEVGPFLYDPSGYYASSCAPYGHVRGGRHRGIGGSPTAKGYNWNQTCTRASIIDVPNPHRDWESVLEISEELEDKYDLAILVPNPEHRGYRHGCLNYIDTDESRQSALDCISEISSRLDLDMVYTEQEEFGYYPNEVWLNYGETGSADWNSNEEDYNYEESEGGCIFNVELQPIEEEEEDTRDTESDTEDNDNDNENTLLVY